MPPKLLCVAGPTASGKTALAVELALHLDGEVVSCDSMQLYRGMDIGTAKPTPEERKGIPHHMLDILDPEESYSASRFVEDASAAVEDILSRGALPILCGGTGFYMQALIERRSFPFRPEDAILREKLEYLYDRFGGLRLWRLLKTHDPVRAEAVHPGNRKRLIRSLEILFSTGITPTRQMEGGPSGNPRYDALWIGLCPGDRKVLYSRIDHRVDAMMSAGLLEETRRLMARDLPGGATALQAIGYKELIPACRGEVPLMTAAENLKRASRRYAKRQLTWFRRVPDIRWFDPELSDTPTKILTLSTDFLSRDNL